MDWAIWFVVSIDYVDGVAEAIGDVEPFAVGGEQHAARIWTHRNSGHDVIGGSGEIVGERLALRPGEGE